MDAETAISIKSQLKGALLFNPQFELLCRIEIIDVSFTLFDNLIARLGENADPRQPSIPKT